MIKFFLTFVTILAFQLINAQNTIIKGHITISNNQEQTPLIFIENITQEKYTTSNEHNDFYLEVQLNDTIKFNAPFYQEKKIVITQEIIHKKEIYIYIGVDLNNNDYVTVYADIYSGNLANDLKRNRKNLTSYQAQILTTKYNQDNINYKDFLEQQPAKRTATNIEKFDGLAAGFTLGKAKNLSEERKIANKDNDETTYLLNYFTEDYLQLAHAIPSDNMFHFANFLIHQPEVKVAMQANEYEKIRGMLTYLVKKYKILNKDITTPQSSQPKE